MLAGVARRPLRSMRRQRARARICPARARGRPFTPTGQESQDGRQESEYVLHSCSSAARGPARERVRAVSQDAETLAGSYGRVWQYQASPESSRVSLGLCLHALALTRGCADEHTRPTGKEVSVALDLLKMRKRELVAQ